MKYTEIRINIRRHATTTELSETDTSQYYSHFIGMDWLWSDYDRMRLDCGGEERCLQRSVRDEEEGGHSSPLPLTPTSCCRTLAYRTYHLTTQPPLYSSPLLFTNILSPFSTWGFRHLLKMPIPPLIEVWGENKNSLFIEILLYFTSW